jgi:hypothetical protein
MAPLNALFAAVELIASVVIFETEPPMAALPVPELMVRE